MSSPKKTKKRGFVMTGGGAKGLYEAGVIQAFHLTGMHFDVVTGSSIGAMNSIVYAEYLRRKDCLPPSEKQSSASAIQALDPFIRAYHYAWLRMASLNLVDDGPTSAVARLKDDLSKSTLDMGRLVRFFWYYTTPKSANPTIPWQDLVRLGAEIVQRIGLFEIISLIPNVKNASPAPFIEAYLARVGLRNSLISTGSKQEGGIRGIFTHDQPVLQESHLDEDYIPSDDDPAPKQPMIDPQITLADYQQAGIEVRLTRANFRSGRLEISAAITPEQWVSYLLSQAWRLDNPPPDQPAQPLGSHRLQVPGNPFAIDAALASGRFPGVFAPFPVAKLFDFTRPENALLKRVLENWLDDPEVEARLAEAYQSLLAKQPEMAEKGGDWSNKYAGWRKSDRLKGFFPHTSDAYVDGGTIDNTPTNSAVDAIREDLSRQHISKRDVELELYVVFLSPEPAVTMDNNADPTLYQVVNRTLSVQSAAKLSQDAATVTTINGFGQKGEMLGDSLTALLSSVQSLVSAMPEEQRKAFEQQVYDQVKASGADGYLKTPQGVIDQMSKWAEDTVSRSLPLHVEEVLIYPDEMPLGTLQLTERLGYKKDNAIRMITMGCYNTLWTLRAHLERQKPQDLDDRDKESLDLARQWMGPEWPKSAQELDAYQSTWRCRRGEDCVFYKKFCAHGALNQ